MHLSWILFAGMLALGYAAPVGPYGRPYGGNGVYRGHQGATRTSESYGYQSTSSSHSGSHAPQGVRQYGGSSLHAGRYGPGPARGHYGAPAAPYRPSGPSRPAGPHAPSGPRAPQGPAYRAPAAPLHYRGDAGYGAGSSHYGPSAAAPSYGPVHGRYGGPTAYSSPAHGVSSQSYEQKKSVSHGREMKYTIRDPYNKGTTHVTETHIVSNREMHGAEAEAAMKKLMGNMGPGSYGGGSGSFHDLANGIGLPFY